MDEPTADTPTPPEPEADDAPDRDPGGTWSAAGTDDTAVAPAAVEPAAVEPGTGGGAPVDEPVTTEQPVATEPAAVTEPAAPADTRANPLTVGVAIGLVVALLLAAFGWFLWYDAKGEVDDLEDQVAEQQEQIDELEADLEDAEQKAALLTALQELISGLGSGEGLDGLLEGEGLEQLLEGTDLEELLGGLLDGEGLDGLLGGGGEGPFDLGSGTVSCLSGDGLGDLFGDGGADIPDDSAAAQYDAVARWVAEERGLGFDEVPEPTFVDADEMARRVSAQIREDYPADDAADDAALLAALGVVEPGTDLEAQYSDFVGGQVAGYYDPETGELVVLGDGDEPLDALELTTVAHELEHALADQALGLPIDDENRPEAADEQTAGLALVEGDATLTMSRFQLASLDLGDLGGLFGDLFGGDVLAQQQALDEAPHYFAASLMFPYTTGLEFVCGLETTGGWDSVDAAYDDPPTTTAQILFPERYGRGEGAVDAPDPRAPGGGWTERRRTTLGAADLLWLFEAPGDDPDAALSEPLDRAAAWAGGEVVQWRSGDRDAVGISLRQREQDAAPALCASMLEWYRASFPRDSHDRDGTTQTSTGRGQSAVIRCAGDTVRIGIAPEVATARAITA